jgi:hypothetical protein
MTHIIKDKKMSKNPIIKDVTDFGVDIADNGFVISYSGKDADGDYQSAKIVVTSEEDLVSEIRRVIKLV